MQRIFHRRIAAADGNDRLILKKRRIAGAAVTNPRPGVAKFFFSRYTQMSIRTARSENDDLAGQPELANEEVFGGDPWPSGIEANRPTLEALVTYLHEQYVTDRRMDVDELFVQVEGGGH
jgi:hypothetical protein